jgi:hypothetical protein
VALYTAHLVVYIELRKSDQESFPTDENVYLIDAFSLEDASKQAEAIVQEINEINDEGQTWDGIPSRIVCIGVRKVSKCQTLDLNRLNREEPYEFKEFSRFRMVVDSEEKIQQLVEGEAVTVLYEG